MKALLKAAFVSCLALGLAWDQAGAATIFNQASCGTTDAPCFVLGATTTYPVTIRAFTFNAPGPGDGLVSFHGSMTCRNPTDMFEADMNLQITTAETAIPFRNGPGGYHVHLGPGNPGFVDSFNLSATRPIAASAAGPVSVFFRINSRPLARCALYNLAFSVVFAP